MKKYALLVGVDACDPKHYGHDNELKTSRTNVNTMYHFLLENYSTQIIEHRHILFGKNATWQNVKYALRSLKQKTDEDKANGQKSMVVLYLSAHSHLKEYESGVKVFLCLYDRLIVEDYIKSELIKFNSDVRFVWLGDTCFSESYVDKELFRDTGKFSIVSRSKHNRFIYKQLNDYYLNFPVKDVDINEAKASGYFLGSSLATLSGSEEGMYGMSYFVTQLIFTWERWKRERLVGSYIKFFEDLNKTLDGKSKVYRENKVVKVRFGKEDTFFSDHHFLSSKSIISNN